MVSTSDRKRVISTKGLRAITEGIIEYPSEKIQKLSEGDLPEEKIFPQSRTSHALNIPLHSLEITEFRNLTK